MDSTHYQEYVDLRFLSYSVFCSLYFTFFELEKKKKNLEKCIGIKSVLLSKCSNDKIA